MASNLIAMALNLLEGAHLLELGMLWKVPLSSV